MLSPAEIEVTKSQAHALVDRVPPEQLDTAVRMLTSPVEDEPLSEEDYALFRECKTALAEGQPGIPMEDLLAEFGLTVDDFPSHS